MMGTKLAASAGASQPIEISHPQKMFWPDEGYTKQHLAEYYRRVFPCTTSRSSRWLREPE
jgi:DNA primase